MISALIPSRQRVDSLKVLVNQLRKLDVEIIVRADNDDKETWNYLLDNHFNAIIAPQPDNMSHAFNEMARVASRDYLWLLNDDVELVSDIDLKDMNTSQYGRTLPAIDKEWACDSLGASNFPLVGRKIYERLGWILPELIPGYAAEVYLYDLCNDVGLCKEMTHINLKHNKRNDATRTHMELVSNVVAQTNWDKDYAALRSLS